MGYMYMCGHATIGIAKALAELGYIQMEEPETEILFETVAGIVNVRLLVKNSIIEKISVIERLSEKSQSSDKILHCIH